MPELLHPGVYVREVSSGVRPIEGVSTSTAAFIGIADKGPVPGGDALPNGRVAEPVMITSLTDYFRRFGGFRRDSFLTYAVQAFYQNGGKRAYIVRLTPKNTTPVDPNFVAAARAQHPSLPISALNEGFWGNRIWIEIAASSDAIQGHFKLIVRYGTSDTDTSPAIVETFDNVTFLPPQPAPPAAPVPPPVNYVRTLVNSRSEFIGITADITAQPAVGKTQIARGHDGAFGVIRYTPDGLRALDTVTDVNMIAIPGQGGPQVINDGIAYCKGRLLQDCFFIGDVGSKASVEDARLNGSQPDDVVAIDQAVTFATTGISVGGTVIPISKGTFGDYGAVYFPWILAADPIGAGSNPRILLPPSGYLAGIYARVDSSRGVFKAPAGLTDSGLAGALSVAVPVSDTEQDRLNPIGVNVIRTAPGGGGIVVWGTRTISTDSEWRYIPVRRMAIFLRVSIYYGIQWAVFEPNDEPLWAALRLNIRSFMLTQFRAGAFQGRKPDDAFFVKCDSSTTTQQDIDNGVVNILVGFAPLKPAEFVVLTLQQKVNQPAA